MPSIKCERCLMECKTQSGLKRHMNRKNPCKKVEPVEDNDQAEEKPNQIISDEVKPADEKTTALDRSVYEARNIIRAHGVTGMEAIDCIVTIFALRECEKLYPRIADPDTFNDTFNPDIKCVIEEGFTSFSKIIKTPRNTDDHDQWDVTIRGALQALEYHPDTKETCKPLYNDVGKMFPLENSDATHKLACYINKNIKFDGRGDTAGKTFQSVIRNCLDGKELGQFFTPPNIVNVLTDRAIYQYDQSDEKREFGRVFDPTCGSGGFLAAAASIDEMAELHGIEIDIRVRLLGFFHALVSGKTIPKIERSDFIYDKLEDAPYDTILSNPPFGVKGLDYGVITNNDNSIDWFPLKSTATGLFLQKIIYSLKIGGRACIVLPLGRELASRAPGETKLRKALLHAVNLHEIISIPSGAFDNTGIRTVALIFDKVAQFGDFIERKKKGKGWTFKIKSDEDTKPATKEVKLTQIKADNTKEGLKTLNETEDIPEMPKSITIEDIIKADWCLSPDEYKIHEDIITQSFNSDGNEIPMVRLGDICEFKPGKSITKAEFKDGIYPVVGGGVKPVGFHDEYNIPSLTTIVSKDGSVGSVSRYITPVYLTGHGYYISWISNKINSSYGFYILKNIFEPRMKLLKRGSSQPALDILKVLNLKIPLPSLEIQKGIADELDTQRKSVESLEESVKFLNNKKQAILDDNLYNQGHLGRIIDKNNMIKENIKIVRLGDMCELIHGKSISKKDFKDGDYPVIGGGKKPIGYHNEYNTKSNVITISISGSCGWISRYNTPIFRSSDCMMIKSKSDEIIEEYLFRLLTICFIEKIQNMKTGAAQPHLDKKHFLDIKIPLPSLEIQKGIADEIDEIDETIKNLEELIKNANDDMKKTLMNYLSGSPIKQEDQEE